MSKDVFSSFIFIFAVILAITSCLWCPIAKETTSSRWKTEIVRHGYGTWETTPDGQVWFKWKEAEPEPEETWLHMNPDGTIEEEKP